MNTLTRTGIFLLVAVGIPFPDGLDELVLDYYLAERHFERNARLVPGDYLAFERLAGSKLHDPAGLTLPKTSTTARQDLGATSGAPA